jgi:SAM-dependent methyltransferase
VRRSGDDVGHDGQMEDVAPDGSPVGVYLALPIEPALGYVRSLLDGPDAGEDHPASVLDLGCGPGRLANPLAAIGHRVVGVDDSAAMLAHLDGVDAVLGDIWSLDLGRRFDLVLALSHLLNDPERSRRLQLLRVCRTHLCDRGAVLVQRYPPPWQPVEGESAVGDVRVHLHDVVHHEDGSFSAVVTYRLGDHRWDQEFTARVVDDPELDALAAATGLVVGETLDADGGWVVLRPDRSSGE